MKSLINNYLAFNKNEMYGFWAVTFLLIVTLSSPMIFDWLHIIVTDKNDSVPFDRLDSLTQQIQFSRTNHKGYIHNEDDILMVTKQPVTNNVILFAFNPNEINEQQWQKLGLEPWLAERILKYRSKGGVFRKKEDLQKIYNFPPTLYARLVPYIQLPEKVVEGTTNTLLKESKPVIVRQVIFDLNLADTTALIKLRGIGSKLAMRIVKFRENLGGFYHINQLKEVYGLDSLTVQEVCKYVYVRNPTIRKININEATAETMKHPYLRPYQAKVIVSYRQQHGNYTSVKDLSNIKVLDAQTIEKLSPYLSY
jgi:competence protein ComEA